MTPMPKLTISDTIKNDLDFYFGKPTIVKFVVNNEYESEVHCPNGWDRKSFVRTIADALLLFDEVKTVHIVSISEKIIN
jgi:hypothetical protein